MDKYGTLYVVATPIGNMGDITRRAAEILDTVDLIAAEDTRRSGMLLQKLGIKKPLISYYKGRENQKSDVITEKLKEGLNVALISDAGTPCISDPGAILVERARNEGITVSPIPGASAAATAFSVAGIQSGYIFLGFLPTKQKDRTALMSEYGRLSLPLVFYSAPHDVNGDLDFLYGQLGERRVYIMREMTKIYEEILVGSLSELRSENPRGEYVLIVSGAEKVERTDLSIEDELKECAAHGMSEKDAVKETAKRRGVPKDVVYKEWLRLSGK
ncbi:MAG: 16S rRNA (cytidine(1402)-2'-O)-methyltransferase [Clostridiales bacterium]|nr:16S rRNA (cytidine(1402)-2'-O)-methyltransferase [Clostridiales bacterium]